MSGSGTPGFLVSASTTGVTATVTLPAGLQTLTIYQDNGGWNIHQLAFS
jgi:hypothetical protein